jgi:putative transposase
LWGYGILLVPRPPRLELPGVPLHVLQRGNNRAACFFSDVDRRFYLKCLSNAAIRRGCAIHAYVLMTNHVHLLVTPEKRGCVGAMLQEVGRRYVRVINTMHGRTGTLWEGRFKSSLVDSETYLFNCYRYIDLNPVRAGLAPHPAAYRWSSHAHYAAGKLDPLISEHAAFINLDQDHTGRQTAYRALFDEEMDPRTLTLIRESVNAGCPLGSESFLKMVEARLGRPVRLPKRGRPAKHKDPEPVPAPVTGKLF